MDGDPLGAGCRDRRARGRSNHHLDLVVDRISGPHGSAFEIRRLDAEPGEGAMKLASAIERALAPELSAPSIKSLAAEGTPSRWYQNLEEFESAALESLDS